MLTNRPAALLASHARRLALSRTKGTLICSDLAPEIRVTPKRRLSIKANDPRVPEPAHRPSRCLETGFEFTDLLRHSFEGGEDHIARLLRNAAGLECRSEAHQIGLPLGMKPIERHTPVRWRHRPRGIEHGLVVAFQLGGGAEQR